MKQMIWIVTITTIVMYGCGSSDSPNLQKQLSEDGMINGVKILTPTGEYYDSYMKSEFDKVYLTGAETPVSETQKIYINFNGATVKKGYGLGESSLVCVETVDVAKAKFNYDEKLKIVEGLKKHFAAANPKIQFITSMSSLSGVDHSVIHIGGSYQDLGCTSGALLRGIAHYDLGNLNDRDTAFVFSGTEMGIDATIEATKTVVSSIMGFESGTFKVTSISEITQDKVKGKDNIHSMARLLWQLGDTQTFDIRVLESELMSLLPVRVELPVGFDRIITATVGASTGSSGKDSGSGGLFGNGAILAILTGMFGSALSDPSTIVAISTLMGIPELGAAAIILGSILNSGGDSTTPDTDGSSKKNTIPDYGALLEISDITTMPVLIGNLRAHIEYLNASYEEETLEALRAMLIVGYSQQYRRILANTTVPNLL